MSPRHVGDEGGSAAMSNKREILPTLSGTTPPPFDATAGRSLYQSESKESFSPYLDYDWWLEFFDNLAKRYGSVLSLAVALHIALLFAISSNYRLPDFEVEPDPIQIEIIALEPQPEEPEAVEAEVIPVAPPPPPPQAQPRPKPTPPPPPPPPPPEPEPEPEIEIAPPPPPPDILVSEQPPEDVVEPEPIPEPLPEPVIEPLPEPLPEPEPVIEIYEPIPDPVIVPEPLPEPIPEPIIPDPEPLPEPIIPEPEPLPEPIIPEPEPLPEAPILPDPVVVPEPAPIVTPEPVPIIEEPLPITPAPVIVETPEPAPEEPPVEIVTTAPTILASPDAPTTQEEADRAVPESQAAPLSDLITGRNNLEQGATPPTGLPGRDPTIAGPLSGGGNVEGGSRLSNPGAGGWTLTAPTSPGGGYDGMLEDIRCREEQRTHDDCPEYMRSQSGRDAAGFEDFSTLRHGGTGVSGTRARAGRTISGDIGSQGDRLWQAGGGVIGSNSINGGGPSTTVLDDTDFGKEFLGTPVLIDEPGVRIRDLFKEEEDEEDDWTLDLVLEDDE